MKKVSLFMAIAAATSLLLLCTAQKAQRQILKQTSIFIILYLVWVQTQGLKDYLVGRMDVDTAYMDEFIKGLNEGATKTSKKISLT